LKQSILIEVCVDSVASAVAAERGGAGRVELCSGLIEGGVTPSSGLIEAVRAAVSLPVHVMIRPRGGDFCYDEDEFKIMRRDLRLARQLGADGVVFGMLTPDGKVNQARCRDLMELARPLSVTFHRAFDMSADLLQALEDLCAVGVDRILTSGGEPTCSQSESMIANLVEAAKGRIAIMAGSGIKPENARAIIEGTGVKEIHAGRRSAGPGPMTFRNPRISMGTVAGREYDRFVVTEENVRNLCAAIRND
jgi:copper homeostasis protein